MLLLSFVSMGQTVMASVTPKWSIHRSNQEEADTRLALQAYLEKGDVVIACKDTNVLVLMVWADTFYNASTKWYFKYDTEQYADIRKIFEFFWPRTLSRTSSFPCDQWM